MKKENLLTECIDCIRKTLSVYFLLVSLTVLGQQLDCKELLHAYNKSMASISRPDSNKTYYMDITVEDQVGENYLGEIHTDHIKIIMTGQAYQYTSVLTDVFQDSINTIMVIKQQKVILINNSSSNANQRSAIGKMTFLRDTIVDMSNISTCHRIIDENGEKLIETVIEPQNKMKDILKVDKLKFVFSEKGDRLLKTVVWHNSENEKSKTTNTFNELNLDFKKVKFNKSVYDIVFNHEGKLNKKYIGYRIIDNRSKQ